MEYIAEHYGQPCNDEYFVQESYSTYMWEHGHREYIPSIVSETLESVLCHEIAHMTFWRHGKKHQELAAQYLQIVHDRAMAKTKPKIIKTNKGR